MRPFALLLAAAAIAGCDAAPNGSADALALTNAADRPIVVSVVDRQILPAIYLAEAVSAEDFESGRLDVGQTRSPARSSLEPDDDLVVFVYARRDRPTPRIEATYGPGAAELVARLDVAARDVRRSGYRITVREAQ
ncbi:MAG TPA: hypothetical protein VF576_02390 [Rubricoccaceae bacterium]|jgi:hypothetical protein